MRIGIDVRLWNQTGVGRYIRNLVIELSKIDKKNEYVLFAGKEDYENIKSQISNIKWKIVKADIKWHSIAEQIKFPKILEKENLNLVHFPYFSLPILYKKPYVVTIHDLIINHYPTGKASTLFPLLYYSKLLAYKYIIYMGAKNAKKIIVPSVSTKNEVIDHLKISGNKIAVTKEAANLATSRKPRAASQKYGKYFLYVGNAYPHKNLERLIKAFNEITREYKDLRLVFVGNKDYFYQKLEKENISDKIVFYGKATDDELLDFYSNAIALVSPSLMEGFGLPILEAMTNNCLVLCSDIPAFREIAKETVIYFNPYSISDIKEKLLFACSNDSNHWNKFKKMAKTKEKEFSWEKMAKETLKVYEETLSSSL